MNNPWLGFIAEDKNVQIMIAEAQIRHELEIREYCTYLEARIERLEQWAAAWKAAAKFNRAGWDWTCEHEGDYSRNDAVRAYRLAQKVHKTDVA